MSKFRVNKSQFPYFNCPKSESLTFFEISFIFKEIYCHEKLPKFLKIFFCIGTISIDSYLIIVFRYIAIFLHIQVVRH